MTKPKKPSSKRAVFHVVPSALHEIRWAIKHDGRIVAYWTLKSEAIRDGRKRARRARPSQLKVHGLNGRFQFEHTYGADPKRSRG